jgi:RNA polymerase sigma factor (sigma-70 family)
MKIRQRKYTISNEEATRAINSNRGLIQMVFNKYKKNSSFTQDEVMAVAMESFLRSYTTLDTDKGSLSTHAVINMTGALMELRRKHWRHLYKKLSFDGYGTVEQIHDKYGNKNIENWNHYTTEINSVNYEKELQSGLDAKKILATLPARDAKIMHMRYIQDLDLWAIAGQLGITYQRVAQLHDSILKKLQTKYKVLVQ